MNQQLMERLASYEIKSDPFVSDYETRSGTVHILNLTNDGFRFGAAKADILLNNRPMLELLALTSQGSQITVSFADKLVVNQDKALLILAMWELLEQFRNEYSNEIRRSSQQTAAPMASKISSLMERIRQGQRGSANPGSVNHF